MSSVTALGTTEAARAKVESRPLAFVEQRAGLIIPDRVELFI